MVATPEIRSSQGRVITVTDAVSTAEVEVTQARTLGVANIPAEHIESTQARLVVPYNKKPEEIQVTQARTLAVVKGRVSDPRVRAWTFTIDGHDFYVLRLGNDETLVYDVYSEQWYVWGSSDTPLWRAYNGTNWLGADGQAALFGSNILVGDDGNGALYFLDPDSDTDDDALDGADVQRSFKRVIQGQVTHRGYNSRRMYDVVLEGSIGDATNEDLVTVNLSFSDDRGNTYNDAGDVTLTQGDYNTRANWRSLGSLTSPGRLLRVTDYGALRRIDYTDASLEE
ncbi:MAG: putative packaged DNA stabilization protein [Prokaryotic dsDNA virus sp.]|nr:MAG: putative packaged DNA stabilization protein [Prokaryotic dsDNA virus sp.]|tara:strand:- start:36 stop:884 length:849 start_codon:yes stop_codon:yes gene_type:complete